MKAVFWSALLGLLVGFVWESFGAVFLWTLVSPQILAFGAALIVWSILGLSVAVILKVVEASAPRYKSFIKPLIGSLALPTLKLTSGAGLLSFRVMGPSIFDVPLYTMTAWLALVYLLDLLNLHQKQ